jgi:hypothetical protein
MIGTVIVLVLAIKFGVGGKSLFDRVCLAIAIVAFVLLIFVDDKLVGLSLAIAIDGVGTVLTLRKLLKDRSSETRLPWSLYLIGALLAIVALETYSVENLLFPIYLAITSAVYVILIKKSDEKIQNKVIENL